MNDVARQLLEYRSGAVRQALLDVEVVDQDDEEPPRLGADGVKRRWWREDDPVLQSQRRRQLVASAPGQNGHDGNDVLRPIILEHEEILRRQVSQKRAVPVTRDDYRRHQRDARAERRSRGVGLRRSFRWPAFLWLRLCDEDRTEYQNRRLPTGIDCSTYCGQFTVASLWRQGPPAQGVHDRIVR